jgi:NFU1 iron-sulfur cluster scaffold homolog, mitochondrial
MPKIHDIEPTPNPNAMKFILKEPVSPPGVSRSYENPRYAESDPLASALFEVEHVASVFYMDRFLTVTKEPFGSWDDLLPKLAKPIREAPAAADQPLPPQPEGSDGASVAADDEELLGKINDVLDERIRPGLAADGGGLVVIGLVDKVLSVRYQGACGSCPSSIAGTLMAIEGMLQTDVDPELSVISV